ncbi:molybdenum-pterin-binding protein [Paenibacillus helianthi]|uniref:Molybdenum-pterin-binding protein n=1 Tax=Paenibacillus helianthi TaxID=1349432 RepID=A0ABX3EUT4_9BACL|nr:MULTISPECIES: TOBE domain-containing protein [Paenibacillus]OKP91602.1 molybdenum-pterin-binding protein [Paenibacillus helianthi]OKP93946.1 molybdenum-pterin-binding protein [Paenibacillus sp. P32E]
MKISARNQFEGKVLSIEEGQVNAKIVVDTGGQKITSIISVEALRDLDLKEGSSVTAVIKASSVMLMA